MVQLLWVFHFGASRIFGASPATSLVMGRWLGPQASLQLIEIWKGEHFLRTTFFNNLISKINVLRLSNVQEYEADFHDFDGRLDQSLST